MRIFNPTINYIDSRIVKTAFMERAQLNKVKDQAMAGSLPQATGQTGIK
jgi:hypothetical protein